MIGDSISFQGTAIGHHVSSDGPAFSKSDRLTHELLILPRVVGASLEEDLLSSDGTPWGWPRGAAATKRVLWQGIAVATGAHAPARQGTGLAAELPP